jgi:iron complex outermembrane receptor protein
MKKALFICLWIVAARASGQGIVDSLFHLGAVNIVAGHNFEKEEAGYSALRIDSAVIDHAIFMDLSSLLSEHSPVYIKDYGRGALATASFRGTSPSHTQVTWNGMNINSPMLGMVDLALVPVFIMDEVQLSASGGSIREQGGGLGGLISITNTPDFGHRFDASYYQSAGSYRTFDEMAAIHLGNPGLQFTTRLYHSYSLNNYPFENRMIIEKDPATGELVHPEQENRDGDYSKYGILQEAYFRTGERSLISVHAWFQDAGRSIPSVMSNELFDEALQRINRQDDRSFRAVAKYGMYAEKTDFTMRSGMVYQNTWYALTNVISGLDPRQVVQSFSNSISSYNSAELELSPSEKVSFHLSASYNMHRINTIDSVSGQGYERDRNELSLFSGAYLQPLPPLQVSVQLRQALVSDQKMPLMASAGVNYRPIRTEELIFKASITRNAHLPSLNDLYWQPGGNSDLLPEKGLTAELGSRYQYRGQRLKVSTGLTAFYSDINNWILWLPGVKGYWQPMNIRRVRAHGIESDLSVTYTRKRTRLQVNGNFSITHTRNFGEALIPGDEAYGKQLPFIPVPSGNVLILLDHRGNYVKYQYNGLGERYLLSSNAAALNDDSYTLLGDEGQHQGQVLYPHHLNSLSLGKKFHMKDTRIVCEFQVKNLFNENYRNILQRFMPGRHYLVMIKIDF